MKELFLTLMLVVVLAIAGGPSVLAETPQQIDSVISHTVINPCDGTTVRFSGTLHHVIRKTADPNGSRISMGSNTQDINGIDARGIQYRLDQAGDVTIVDAGGQGRFTVTEDAPVLSQGAVSDFLLHINLQITIREDGEIVATVDRLSGECRDAAATPSSSGFLIESAATG